MQNGVQMYHMTLFVITSISITKPREEDFDES